MSPSKVRGSDIDRIDTDPGASLSRCMRPAYRPPCTVVESRKTPAVWFQPATSDVGLEPSKVNAPTRASWALAGAGASAAARAARARRTPTSSLLIAPLPVMGSRALARVEAQPPRPGPGLEPRRDCSQGILSRASAQMKREGDTKGFDAACRRVGDGAEAGRSEPRSIGAVAGTRLCPSVGAVHSPHPSPPTPHAHRPQGVAVLRRARARRRQARRRVVGDARPAWRVARCLRGGDGSAHRRRPGERRTRHAPRRRRRDLRPPPGTATRPYGPRLQPRRPHVRVALRPPHRRLRASARHRPPRGSRAHRRPDGRPRLRPRHDGAAAQHLDGFHRRRDGRDDRRAGVGVGAARIRVVGAARPRRGVARDALAAAGERHLVRPQHARGPRCAARCRIPLPARRRPAGEQGAAAVRPGRVDARALHRPAEDACTSSSTRPRGCGSGR